MKFIKIVKFLDGTYGVRSGIFDFEFYENVDYTWLVTYSANYCHHTLEKAREIYKGIKDKRKIIKDVGTPIKGKWE